MEKSVRVHRVGTVTFGCILIVFGSLFLAHVFIPVLSYAFIFRLWPFILILLGVEVLVGNCRAGRAEQSEGELRFRFEYDKTAIVLMVCLTMFAMVMAAVDVCMQWETMYR